MRTGKDQKDSWYFFVKSYLKISELACLEMLHQRHVRYRRMFKPPTIINSFEIKDLYISTIYNIKHAIEIMLKEISLTFSDTYQWGHSVKDVFNDLKKKVPLATITKTHKRLCKEIEELCRNEEIKQEIKDILIDFNKLSPEDTMKNMEEIVLKYHHLDFLRSRISDSYKIEDSRNDAFRYPENGLVIELKYQEIVEKITKNDIEDILSDLDKINRFYLDFTRLLLLHKKNETSKK